MEMNQEKTTSGVRAIARAVSIVTCLNNNMNSLTDISKECGISYSTTHRLLKTLEELHLVTQNSETHQYYLGPLFIELSANSTAIHRYLVARAREEMNRLAKISSEEIELATLVEGKYVRLDNIPSTQSLRVVENGKGRGQPLIGSPARTLISQLDDEEGKNILAKAKIARLTEHSMIDKKEILAQVPIIRRQGYAISCGERVAGAMGISAPIKNYVYPVVIAIIGTEFSIKPREKYLVEELLKSTNRVSESIRNIFKRASSQHLIKARGK